MGACGSGAGCGSGGPALRCSLRESAELMGCDDAEEVEEEVMASCKLLRASAEGSLDGIREALAEGAELHTRTAQYIVFPVKSMEDMAADRWPPLPEQCALGAQGLEPLMLAAKEGWPDAVRLLLACRASPHAHDEDGLQALHFAAQAGCQESCRALLESGALAAAKDDSGRDAFACLPDECITGPRERAAWQALLRPARASPADCKDQAEIAVVAQHGAEVVGTHALDGVGGAGGL